MADHEQQHQPSASGSSGSDGRELVLVARGAAFGLPTACPDCLPAYLYLCMSGLDFSIHYNNNLPDSDDLPSLEYGDLVSVASNAGGFIDFLKRQNLADLDAGFSSPEVAELRSLTAMVDTYLKAALLCELWDNDNVKVANQIYFSALPGPINKLLYWKQQLKVNEMLCLKTKNREGKVAELYRKAAEAYESLSVRLGDEAFFMKKRPSSLDAFFLSHALFVLHLPLEGSKLKEEFLKHVNLVNYAEKLQKEFLKDRGLPPIAQPVFSASRTGHSSSSHKPAQDKVRSEKEKRLKRRAKYFLAAQFAAIVGFVLVWGFVVDESLVEYEGGDAEGQGPGNQAQVASQ